VERCLADSADAWAELLRRFRAPLLRAIQRSLGSWGRDCDRVEEVLSRLWEALMADNYRRLRAYDAGRASLGTYLASRARRLATGRWRALARHRAEQLGERAHEVVSLAPSPWPAEAVPSGYLALLTPRERDYLQSVLLAAAGTAGAWRFSRAYAAQLERRLREKVRRYLAERAGGGMLG
jgi:DNA-directed RNA polymerase specialized sigma24 family protein